jgi:hypothetical protein
MLRTWPSISVFEERNMFFGGANLAAVDRTSDTPQVVGWGDNRRGGRAVSLD